MRPPGKALRPEAGTVMAAGVQGVESCLTASLVT